MKCNFYSLRFTSPFVVSMKSHKSNFVDSISYVPGQVIRGALAEWMFRMGKSDKIKEIVNRMRFGNFFPSNYIKSLSLPFPQSSLSCKYNSGFENVPQGYLDSRGHGIRDILIPLIVYNQFEKLGVKFPFTFSFTCNKCGSRMEPISGFYVHTSEGWHKFGPSFFVQTKISISRHRHSSQEGQLYRVVSLNHPFFVGRICYEKEEHIEVLKEAIKDVGVGALTSRGFGFAELKDSKSDIPPIKDRLYSFQNILTEIWYDFYDLAVQLGYSQLPPEPDGLYFSIDLLSPAVLIGKDGLPTLKLTLKIGDQILEPILWMVSPAAYGGWSTAWGLPKPTSIAADRGSVYVYKTSMKMEKLLPYLEDIEEKGVGLHSKSGWGEVLIPHPFHKEVNPL